MTKRLVQQQDLMPPTSLLIKEASIQPYRRLEPEQPGPAAAITPRQQEVLFCLVEGKPTKKICTELGISEGTAKVHISAIFRALRVRNRTQRPWWRCARAGFTQRCGRDLDSIWPRRPPVSSGRLAAEFSKTVCCNHWPATEEFLA